MKKILKGRRFTSIDDIKSASLNGLKAIPMIMFEKCFKDWQERWHKYQMGTTLKETTLM
jgi:hypothetical protein